MGVVGGGWRENGRWRDEGEEWEEGAVSVT